MKKRRSKFLFRGGNVLIITGIILMALWGVHRFFYNRSLSLSDAILASYAQTHSEVAYPIHITIGEAIRLPVVESGKVNGVWAVSQTSANHVQASALPGEAGNIIIYGHNLNTIFGYLVDQRVGTVVDIRTNDGKLHKYKISDIHIVDPSQTDLLAPTTTEILTLYTCTGFLDSQRFVARATPVK
jgi:LPXTG-site transpeptidase (sortase) family protein